MSEASFDRVISEHLALCERNRRLERRMPLDNYRDQVEGGSGATVSSDPQPVDPEPTENVAGEGRDHWLDPDSFWETTEQRALPEFDWGDD